ncbi:MAG TPA: hypothetical protein VGG42_05925 [Acidobacteriaceae bacterium]|jgi:hypothetical protein
MKVTHIPLHLAVAAMVSTFVLAGCSKSAPPANTQNSTPAAQQPAAANNPPPPPADNATPAATPAQAASTPAPQAAPPPAARVTIPPGTPIRVRLDEDLGSKISQAGETFDATVADDVVVHGQTVIPRHARAEGVVIDAKSLGHFKGGALLELRLERVKTRWGSYPVSTSTMSQAEKGKGKRTALFAGGGGALGAIVGGLAGGGKGALIGGLAGAGAGTAGSAMTGNKEIFLPTETVLIFRIEHPVHITEQ